MKCCYCKSTIVRVLIGTAKQLLVKCVDCGQIQVINKEVEK